MNTRDLLKYNYEANLKFIAVFENDRVSEYAIDLFMHILNAQHVWNHRINRVEPKFSVWFRHSSDQLKSLNLENFQESIEIVEKADPGSLVKYKNSQGTEFENTVEDILSHIVNHSTYHRGQIALIWRNEGKASINTDYILYQREKEIS